MGDTGSTFLGAVLSGIFFNCDDFLSFISLILISSPLLMDALACVLRRYCAKQNIFASQPHLYQRLSKGLSHSPFLNIYLNYNIFIIINQSYGLSGLFWFCYNNNYRDI